MGGAITGDPKPAAQQANQEKSTADPQPGVAAHDEFTTLRGPVGSGEYPPDAWARSGTAQLAEALDQPDLAFKARWGLFQIGTDEAVEILKKQALKALSQGDMATLEEIASLLADLGTTASREALRDVAKACIDTGHPHSLCLFYLDESVKQHKKDMSLSELKETVKILESANREGHHLYNGRHALEDRQSVVLDPDNPIPFIRRNFQVSERQLQLLETLAKQGRVELQSFKLNPGNHIVDPQTRETAPNDPRMTIAILPPGETYQVPPDSNRKVQETLTFSRRALLGHSTTSWEGVVAPDEYPPRQ